MSAHRREANKVVISHTKVSNRPEQNLVLSTLCEKRVQFIALMFLTISPEKRNRHKTQILNVSVSVARKCLGFFCHFCLWGRLVLDFDHFLGSQTFQGRVWQGYKRERGKKIKDQIERSSQSPISCGSPEALRESPLKLTFLAHAELKQETLKSGFHMFRRMSK